MEGLVTFDQKQGIFDAVLGNCCVSESRGCMRWCSDVDGYSMGRKWRIVEKIWLRASKPRKDVNKLSNNMHEKELPM